MSTSWTREANAELFGERSALTDDSLAAVLAVPVPVPVPVAGAAVTVLRGYAGAARTAADPRRASNPERGP